MILLKLKFSPVPQATKQMLLSGDKNLLAE